MNLTPLTYDAVLEIAENMREDDRREIFATRWNDDPVELAEQTMLYKTFGWVAWNHDKPVAVIGAIPVSPGFWALYCYGTDEFRQIRFSLTKFAIRCMMPAMIESGARRAECLSIEDHTDAHGWLRLLGAKPDKELVDGLGRNGETFIRFVWRRDDARRI